MSTFTENDALSYSDDDPLMKLFYHSLRDISDDKMRQMVRDAWTVQGTDTMIQQRRLYTLKLIFHLRWCRGGKGERRLFHIAIQELIELGSDSVVRANLQNIPYFGYWKDLWCLLDTPLEQKVLNMYASQLKSDLTALQAGETANITLAAKWAPSEGKGLDREKKLVTKLCKVIGVNKCRYRKNYIVPLRNHLKLVETQLCAQQYADINYAHVPSLARVKYTQAFRKHDPERFSQYMTDVAAGKEKMNIKLVFPYQLVQQYVDHRPLQDGITDSDIDIMWNELVKQTRADLVEAGADLQALAIADLSGSMNGIPLYNSVALSLLWAELCEGRFHGHFYVFSRTAKLIKIQGTTLAAKVKFVMKHAEIVNTNFQAVFDDMLTHATMWSVPQELYPQKLYVFTDGQFDCMVNNGQKTHLDTIAEKHSNAGYKMPEIIYWNLRGEIVDFPSPGDRKGVAMLSGFSPQLMKLIMKGKDLTPVGIMLDAISDPELDRITLGA